MTKPAETLAGIEFYGGYQVYSDTGIDLTQLRRNLGQSLEDRWTEAARSALWLAALAPQRPNRLTALQDKPGMFDPGRIVQHLIQHKVEFVVIGGLAMIAHGSSYVTKDLDICYRRTPDNLAAIETAFATLHPYFRGAPAGLPFRFDAPTIQAGLNFTLVSDLGDVDLLGEVSGVGFYDQVLAQSEEKFAFGANFRVLSIEGLIAAKKAAGRNKDRAHLLELAELKKLRDSGSQGANHGKS